MNNFLPASVVALCTACTAVPLAAQVRSTPDRTGNALQFLVPAGAAALAWYEEDREGLKELGYALALSQGTTEALKHIVRSRRPDGTGLGFPSGHTSVVFASATFVQQRYGTLQSLPFYGLATLTAYQRVHTHHHFAKDVVGAAIIGASSSLLLTHKLGPGTSASVGYAPGGAWLHLEGTW